MMMQSGAGNGEIAVAATLVGLVTAGAGFLLAHRIFGGDEAQGLDALVAQRGLILWARPRSPEQEALAQEILLAHGARAVRVHEIDLEKQPEDLPLGFDFDRIRGSAASRSDTHRLSCGTAGGWARRSVCCWNSPMTIPELSRSQVRRMVPRQSLRACLGSNAA